MSTENREKVVLSVSDLFFLSKLKTALETQNCSVRLAPNETEVLKAVEKERPSLLILDLENSQHDPRGIIQAIREEKNLKDLPILAYTNHTRILEWEDKIKEERTVVVSNNFISTYISDFVGLKTLFEDNPNKVIKDREKPPE